MRLLRAYGISRRADRSSPSRRRPPAARRQRLVASVMDLRSEARTSPSPLRESVCGQVSLALICYLSPSNERVNPRTTFNVEPARGFTDCALAAKSATHAMTQSHTLDYTARTDDSMDDRSERRPHKNEHCAARAHTPRTNHPLRIHSAAHLHRQSDIICPPQKPNASKSSAVALPPCVDLVRVKLVEAAVALATFLAPPRAGVERVLALGLRLGLLLPLGLLVGRPWRRLLRRHAGDGIT